MKIYLDLQKQAITKTTDENIYQGDIYSNVFEILFYNYTDSNWFPTMSQLAPNGRKAGEFTADALNVGESHEYTEDGVTYLKFDFTMGTSWVLMKGRSEFYIWFNRLGGAIVQKKCVGVVNIMIDHSTEDYFIADPTFNPNVKTYIDACIAELGDGSPKYFDTASNIANCTEDKGLAVATDTGHLYYWDETKNSTTKYTDSGLVYNDLSAYYTKTEVDSALSLKADKTTTYTKTESDNTFAPKSTALTHSGNQLKDYNGNDIYPNVANNQIEITNLTPQFRNTFRNLSIKNIYTYKIDIATTDGYTNFNMVNFVADVGDTLVFKRSIFEQNFNILATYDDGTTAQLLGMYTNISGNGLTKTYGEVTLTKNLIGLGIYKPGGNELHCEIDIIPIKEFDVNVIETELTILSAHNIYYDLVRCNFKIGDVLKFDLTENENLTINILGVTTGGVSKILLNHYSEIQNILVLTDDIKYLGVYIAAGHTNTFNFKVEKVDKELFPLAGKKYGALGDSITVGYNADNKSYAYYASQQLDLIFTNYGISGNRLAVDSPDDPADPMCIRYADMADDLDIITVMGGTNDCASQAPIGTNTDTTNDTFKGGLNILLTGLLNKYVGKKIGFITPTQRYYQNQWINNEKQEPYVNAMIEMCRLYSIPCLDLYHCGGITTKVDSNANGLLADGLHPSTAGQKVLTNKVVEFIKSL